ncbi:hypothetical protein CLAFUW4_20095 [Fulvia fulva]|uniref:uncharacterized protein n=1 Tax=Passalora fulva TaxID=5499 RepID=UPI002852B608|nr:uncharacterized protein CLAFUR5_20095 [Fulvia fulva]KAK4612012.1 hypothetical protein CLAFUR4_20095 [Fulvia fulva]KAK4612365.1 hypothetical protein CLAFUR0_20095 [Fulvia fulva]WMI39042.1 hypothetical protein CLAFUR5_20095 [Fulvia fulva]WPV21288.1 hypothetical protein CLAFUW4_20095 [Fulvia fulva]WPV35985.1 hypothetical protein CLAFUW7_20095 [Fulvia fulva]
MQIPTTLLATLATLFAFTQAQKCLSPGRPYCHGNAVYVCDGTGPPQIKESCSGDCKCIDFKIEAQCDASCPKTEAGPGHPKRTAAPEVMY